MAPVDIVLSLLTAILATLVLGGLAFRHRIHTCFAFAAFLAISGTGGLLIVLWPRTFWTWPFWLAWSVVDAGLRVATAFEIAFKTLRPPLYVGRRRMRVLLPTILLGTLASVLFYPRSLRTAFDFTLLVESTSYGIGWMFGAFLLVVLFYRVPIDPLYRDVAGGFAILNSLVFYREALFNLDPWFGLGTAAGRDLITKTLYPCLLAFWNVSAWRRDEPTAFSPEVEQMLQPWRTRR